jgi:hypothetical protein
MVAFRLGNKDRELLLPIFYPYTDQSFRELDRFHAFVNSDEEAYRLKARKPYRRDFGKKEILNRVSWERYGVPREAIEEAVQRWHGH